MHAHVCKIFLKNCYYLKTQSTIHEKHDKIKFQNDDRAVFATKCSRDIDHAETVTCSLFLQFIISCSFYV